VIKAPVAGRRFSASTGLQPPFGPRRTAGPRSKEAAVSSCCGSNSPLTRFLVASQPAGNWTNKRAGEPADSARFVSLVRSGPESPQLIDKAVLAVMTAAMLTT
jgi:hypothetical protein